MKKTCKSFVASVTVILILVGLLIGCTPVNAPVSPPPSADAGTQPSASSGQDPSAPMDAGVIKIGVSVPMTGSLATEGQFTLHGYELWAKVVNEHGGIQVGDAKMKVELIKYDDQSDAKVSAQLTEKLITEDGVNFLLAPYSSTLVLATSSIAEKYKVINIAPSANSMSIYTRGYEYVYSTLTTGARNLSGCVSMIADYKLDVTNAAILTPDAEFPILTAEQTKTDLEAAGIKVGYFTQYPKDISDFSSIISEIKSAKCDAILCSGYFADATLLVKQLKEQKVSPKFLIFTGPTALPEFTETLGTDAEGICGHVWWAKDLAWKGPVFANSEEYAKLFEAEYGSVPTYHAAAGSASGLILQMAIEAAGSIETEAVKTALDSMDTETFFGLVKFNEYNMNMNGFSYPVQIQNGKAVLLYPSNVKQAEIVFPMLPWDQKQ